MKPNHPPRITSSTQGHPSDHTTNDLFAITMGQLHQEAPPGLVESLKTSLEQIRRKNPNSAQTAKSCLDGLAGAGVEDDPCTLLKVLTAAYLINGGVMLKYQEEEANSATGAIANQVESVELPQRYQSSEDLDLKFLEAELECFELEDSPGLKREKSEHPHAGTSPRPPLASQEGDTRWSLHHLSAPPSSEEGPSARTLSRWREELP